MRPWVLLLVAAACDTGLKFAVVVSDSGPPDASASCLAANDHSDYQFIQDEIFGAGITGMYQQCSFSSCHDRSPPTDGPLNLTPCPDGTATCGAADYDALLSYTRLVFDEETSTLSGAPASQHPEYKLAHGTGDSITVADVSGMRQATLTDADDTITFDASWVDKSIVLTGSMFSGNRGTFKIVAVDPAAHRVSWRSTSARDEASYSGTWTVIESGAGDDLAVAANDVTLTDAGATIDAARVGQWITIRGATTSANNGTFKITAVPDATHVTFTNTNAAKVSEAFNGTWRLGRSVRRVIPYDPDNSYLLIKLGRGDEDLRFGDLMPQGATDPLCAEKIDAIVRWIEAGAPDPSGTPAPADAGGN